MNKAFYLICYSITNMRQNINNRLVKLLLGLMPLFGMKLSYAAGNDLAGMVKAVEEGASSSKTSVLIICQFIGVIFVAGGLIALKNKSKLPAQVSSATIFAGMGVGAVLICLAEFIKRTQSQMGLEQVDVS